MFGSHFYLRAAPLLQLTALLCLCATGCSPQRTKAAPAVTAPRPIGEVAMVNTAAGFVLIDHGPAMNLPAAGTELVIRGDNGETARVKVTAERKRPFITADIISGTPSQRERAYE